ncbi:MAG: hypothetical protein ACK5TO_15375, partial [Planctomycetaceae bacterium]
MELAICPTCKQSVLDDDAVECPFCGSPMKPGAAPARPQTRAPGCAPPAREGYNGAPPPAKPPAGATVWVGPGAPR